MPIKTKTKEPTYGPPIADGPHPVVFEDFYPLDQDQVPILSPQTQGGDGGKLVIRYHVKVLGGTDDGKQIPGSVDADTYSLASLVKMFGGDPDKVKINVEDPDSVGLQLVNIQNQLTKLSLKVDLQTRSGWVVNTSVIPVGTYHAKFYEFTSRHNGVLGWVEKEHPEYGLQRKTYGNFIVQSKGYKNVKVPFSLIYPFEIDPADGLPFMAKTQKGVLNSVSKRWWNFMETLGVPPEMFDVDSVKDKGNLVPEINDALVKADKMIEVAVNDGGWADLKNFPVPPRADPPEPTLFPIEQAKKTLFEVIIREVKTQGNTAFGLDGKLTPEGKEWCKTNLKPIAIELGVSNKFDDMTIKNIHDLLNAMGFKDDANKITVPVSEEF